MTGNLHEVERFYCVFTYCKIAFVDNTFINQPGLVFKKLFIHFDESILHLNGEETREKSLLSCIFIVLIFIISYLIN